MPDTRPSYEHEWHLDKKVPISLILAIIGQTMAFVWWAAQQSTRIEALEKSALAAVPRLESVIRLETKMDELHLAVHEIKEGLKELTSRGR